MYDEWDPLRRGSTAVLVASCFPVPLTVEIGQGDRGKVGKLGR